MAVKYLFLFCVLFAGCSANVTSLRDKWIDPTSNTTLTITTNATSTLRIGDVVHYTCTAAGLSQSTATMQWTEAVGDYQIDVTKGRNPLVLTKVIQASDNGKELLCQTSFYNTHGQSPNTRYYYYYISSERILLNVEGVSQIASKPIYTAGQSVTMTSNLTVTTHHTGDGVEYSCKTNNIPTAMLEVRQVKGPYEMKVYAGAQPSRLLKWTLDSSDSGTSIYCLAFGLDPRFNSYVMYAQRIPINIV